jgi:FlgD Ig-like domain
MRPRLFFLPLLTLICCLSSPLAQTYTNVQLNAAADMPEETGIAINPMNPDNIIGVAQAPCRFYASSDGGETWTNGFLDDPYDLGDPSVVFDGDGNAYYCYIGLWSHTGIFVNRSTDGGYTWQEAGSSIIDRVGAQPFEDKSYPVADCTTSPYRGNVYVGWTQFDTYGSSALDDSTRILFSRSLDHGISWSQPLRISDSGGDCRDQDDTVEGAVPAVGPDGTVYVAWSGPRGIEFDLSTNGGLSFGADRIISDQPGGWDFDVPGLNRCNGMPITKADYSPGPYNGRVYVCWSDQRHGDTDVFLISSDDNGDSWSPRVRVNTDQVGNGRDQFFPWIDVDPVTGIIYAVFYDRRDDPGNLLTHVYLAVSIDGGASFTNEKISASAFEIHPQVFFGDYIGISAFGGRVRPLWMRTDDDDLSLWTALIDYDPMAVDVDLPTASGLTVSPNPVRTTARIYNSRSENGRVLLTVFDATGRVVRHLSQSSSKVGSDAWTEWDGRDGRGQPIPSGIYYVGTQLKTATRITIIR